MSTPIVSSISGLEIYAPSAGYAPTNGADVSAVASAYAESAASGKLDSTASSQFITSTDGLATTEYVDSSVSSKLDTTAFSTVSSNFLTSETVTATAGDGVYITSINGMGLSGQGGGGGGVVTSTAGTVSYVTSINDSAIAVKNILPNATQISGTIGFYFMPAASPFGQPTGVISPLQYATGACLAMDNGSFKSYYKGNELFVTNTSYGVVRMEVHQSRGERVYGSSMNSATGFHIHGSAAEGQFGTAKKWKIGASGISGQSSTSTPWQYGYDEYNKLTSVHDTVSANSASWGGGGGGGVDSATVSAIASAYGHSALSSIYAGPGISYGGADDPMIGINYDGAGPLGTDDNNLLICKTDGTTIGVNAAGELVSLVGGGVDSATVSAIASSYAESAVSSKQDSSAMTAYALSSDVSGVIDTVSSNSATWGGGATGNYVETSAVEVGVGYLVTASETSLAQGSGCKASSLSFAQGRKCNATNVSFAQGLDASADDYSIAAGGSVSARQTSVAFGYSNRAYEVSLVAGTNCSASSRSVALGTMCRATATSMAVGLAVSGFSGVTAFGKYNSGRYGTGENGVAFVIGDGSNGSLHDLMRVTKDGEITMYSSTADTTGTGIMSAIRAISAAATGGGGGVVTATGSASATAGTLWFPTTSYLVSSINGSAILPYGYSALSANSANWTITTSAVSANSANWNSAYSLISGVTALMDAI